MVIISDYLLGSENDQFMELLFK